VNIKAFLFLLVATLVVGVGLGGAAIGVVVLSNGDEEETSYLTLSTQPLAREREASKDEANGSGITQIDQAPLAQSQVGQAFSDGGGLTGTIERIEGDVITINTFDGLSQASVGSDTFIQTFTEGTVADLEVGLPVRVVGQQGENGTLVARSLDVTPVGGSSGFGGGFRPSGGQLSQGNLDQIRQRFQSGDLSQEELVELRQQFRNQFDQTGSQGNFGGRGGSGTGREFMGGRGTGLVGVLQSIEANTVTLDTFQGAIQVATTPDTIFRIISEGSFTDLLIGLQVMVVGQPGEDQIIEARSILIAPQGERDFFDGGL
jgi:hypothetical protein